MDFAVCSALQSQGLEVGDVAMRNKLVRDKYFTFFQKAKVIPLMRPVQSQPRELEQLTQGHLMLENKDLLEQNSLFIPQFLSTSPFCSVGEQNQRFQICASSLLPLLPSSPSLSSVLAFPFLLPLLLPSSLFP